MDEQRRKHVEEIMAGMECRKGFQCVESQFEHLCKARDFGLPDYVDCLETEETLACEFAVPFAHACLCRCPLRVYLAKVVDI